MIGNDCFLQVSIALISITDPLPYRCLYCYEH